MAHSVAVVARAKWEGARAATPELSCRARDLFGPQEGMRRGEDRWWYEGYAASWDDLNPMAKLKMISAAPNHPDVR